jgi:ketosteroid isomerase-like protein
MKKNFVFFCVVTILSCSHNQTTTEKTPSLSANEKLVQQYFEYFNKHNFEKMAAMYAATADFKDPSLGPGIVKQTRMQTTEKYTQLAKVFPDLHDQIIQIYPSGNNHVIVEFVSTGTGPGNEKFELPICSILTIEDGLITKDFTYYDNFNEENK